MRSAKCPSIPLLALAICTGAQAQELPGIVQAARLDSLKSKYALQVSRADQRLETLKPALGLTQEYAFQLRGGRVDESGQFHGRFSQFYRGVRIWGGEVITHQEANGRFQPETLGIRRSIGINVQPSLSSQDAVAIVHAEMAPKGPYTQLPSAELVVYPETRRVIHRFLTQEGTVPNAIEAEDVVERYTLAYFVQAKVDNPKDRLASRAYIIDAHSGKVLKTWSTLTTAGTPVVGTGISQYSGNVAISTTQLSASSFEMRDMTRGTVAHPISGEVGNIVYDLNHGSEDSVATGTIYTNSTNTWGDGANYGGGSTTSANGQTAAVDAAYGIQVTWDYFKNIHGRNGIDDKGTATYARVHAGVNWENAHWDASCFCMSFGDGSSGSKVLTELDVAAHEIGHGINHATAGLVYIDESGGLNESNSDIFGTMIEFYAMGAGGAGNTIPDVGGNWTLGEQMSADPLRYMYKPSKDGLSPDAWSPTMRGLDVHYTSGPMNRAFYFLSAGASATSTSDYYTPYLTTGMNGIGNTNAAKIWYKAMADYLLPTADYKEARSAALRAAANITNWATYNGQPVTQAQAIAAVKNAFAGINVGITAAQDLNNDSVAPTVTLAVSGTSGNITFTPTVSDNVAVTSVEYWVDDMYMGRATAAPWTFVYDSWGWISASDHTVLVKAYDAAGNAGLAAVTFPVDNQSDQLTWNTGFETGSYAWSADLVANRISYISYWLGYDPTKAHSGNYYAVLGGVTNQAHTEELMPTKWYNLNSTAPDLAYSFWLRVATQQTVQSVIDKLDVNVYDRSGNVLATLATFSNMDASSGYVQRAVAIPSSVKSGPSLRVGFKATQAGNLRTSFYIDDIAFVLPNSNQSKNLYTQDSGSGDVLDLAVLAGAQGSNANSSNWVAAADLNLDGRVDEADLALFLNGF